MHYILRHFSQYSICYFQFDFRETTVSQTDLWTPTSNLRDVNENKNFCFLEDTF